eukprot:4647660-Pyramimonas_sp.AAC.1
MHETPIRTTGRDLWLYDCTGIVHVLTYESCTCTAVQRASNGTTMKVGPVRPVMYRGRTSTNVAQLNLHWCLTVVCVRVRRS